MCNFTAPMKNPSFVSRATAMSKTIATTKKLLALAALLALLPAAHALSLPFYEPFTYPIGNLLGTNDSATTLSIGDSTGTGTSP